MISKMILFWIVLIGCLYILSTIEVELDDKRPKGLNLVY